jgi:enoyl-[acyl-carrier-protein] reductase (NADH)
VANLAAFLFSPLSAGINASTMVIDAGMSANMLDEDVVKNRL